MALPAYDPPWLRTVEVGTKLHEIRAWWREPHRLLRAVRAYRDLLAVTPASIAYSFTLFVTWWTLHGTSEKVGHRLILSASTNLRNLQDDPIQVLVASAFWTDGGFPWGEILILLTVMAAAERWLGSLRWILVVAIGHIGATLIVALGISRAVERDLIPLRVTIATDVGPSYGISAMLGAFAFRLRGKARLAWIAGLLIWYGVALVDDRTFTDYGHLFALLLGLLTGAAGVLVARKITATLRRRAARASAPGSGRDGVGDVPLALHEPHGGLDQARGDGAEHGHQ
ncbi:rhomboid family intramembrane serine protease [Nocardia sp. NPDC057668]|uniref:rhomboid family intramembrane serine protease n=1 Tax=Nocardia sp. NPDC057668 TaxID=3346202 RepID=UPI00366B3971